MLEMLEIKLKRNILYSSSLIPLREECNKNYADKVISFFYQFLLCSLPVRLHPFPFRAKNTLCILLPNFII